MIKSAGCKCLYGPASNCTHSWIPATRKCLIVVLKQHALIIENITKMLNNAQTRNVEESEKYISGFDSLSGAAPNVNGFFWAATFPPSKFGGNLWQLFV